MTVPERIHINWNASDGYEAFMECGINATRHYPPTPEQITEVLTRQKGRLFRLMGWIDEPFAEVVLAIEGEDSTGLQIASRSEPSFAGTFIVATEPPPMIIRHGDYRFDLIKAENAEY